MSHFLELTQYKNNIAYKLITNEDLVKALVNNTRDFLNQPLPNNFDSTSLIYTQIFPWRVNPSIETTPKSYITMSFGNFKYINNCFKSGIVTFYIFMHKSLIPTDVGLRYDYILSEIDALFNKQYDVGVFGLELSNGGGDFQVNDDYFGAMMPYKFTDFQ